MRSALLILSLIFVGTLSLRFEAEHGHVIGGASHSSDKSSLWSNNAVVDVSQEGRIIFTVHSKTDLKHAATIRYTAPNGGKATIKVNGHAHDDAILPLALSPNSHNLALNLRRGINTVVLDHVGGDFKIDYLDVPQATPLAARGATVQYEEHEAEDTPNDGTVIGPDRTYQKLPSEASGRRAVTITGSQYVLFNITKPANAMAIRFSIADTPDGAGQVAKITVSADGFSKDLTITSKYSWAYGSYPFTKRPSDGGAHHFYDEVRTLFGKTLPAGATIKITGASVETTIDLADFYLVADAFKKPADALDVKDYGADPTGAQDSTENFKKAIKDASSKGKTLWISEGNFAVKERFTIEDKVTIRGAGPWYSNVFATVLHGVGFFAKEAVNGGTSGIELYDFAITGATNVRIDEQKDSGVGGAPTKSLFQNLWIEHTKCGFWLDGPFDGLHVTDTTMRNLYADGVNFHQGVTNSVIQQSNLRNLGDDGLAMWSEKQADKNNVFKFNTIQVPVLANSIALYGGESNSATDNIVSDSICDGGGLQVANRFDAIKLSGKTDMSRNTVWRSGAPSRFGAWHNGAVWVWANQGPISDVTFEDLEIYDSSWAGITFWDGTSKVSFKNVTVDTSDWVFELHSVAGQADLTNVVAKNIKVVGTSSCVGEGFKLNSISGNDYPLTSKCMGF